MRHLSIDFETKSNADIKKTGSWKYIRDPGFSILLCAWALDDGPVNIYDLTDPVQRADFDFEFRALLFADDVVIHAYNASFELQCIARHFDIPITPDYVHRFRCTMVHGAYCGYCMGLGVTGEVLGLPQDKRKMAVGTRLISLFCKPQKSDRRHDREWWCRPQDEPEKWELFKKYCVQDVETEREIGRRLSKFPMPMSEQRLWELDILSNNYGVGADLELTNGALTMIQRNTDALTAEAVRITGLDNPNSLQQLTGWLKSRGVPADTLTKSAVSDLLESDLPQDVRRLLEIRRELGKTSCKKYDAILACACDDGRVRGVTQYYGANRTGRYCLAEGTPVTVYRDDKVQEVPIEAVRRSDLLWDGTDWVTHEGVVCMGDTDVITYDGITATPEHEVYVDAYMKIPLIAARDLGVKIWTGESTPCMRS